MGNICTSHEEKIIYLENRLEEQKIQMDELNNQNIMLRRNNIYFKRRLEREQELLEKNKFI